MISDTSSNSGGCPFNHQTQEAPVTTANSVQLIMLPDLGHPIKIGGLTN